MRPARTEIIVCTGLRTRGDQQLWGDPSVTDQHVSQTLDIGTAAVARPSDNLGYARVSTADQNLAAQRNRLLEAGAIRIFTDVVPGKRFDRPGPSSPDISSAIAYSP